MKFSDLPSDLEDQLPAGNPPPAWFPVTGVITTSIEPSIFKWYSSQFQGVDPSAGVIMTSLEPGWATQFGERQEDEEVDPIQILDEMKLKQEMSKDIPQIANRYTEIDPLSPMFRANRPKYGYGGLGDFNRQDRKNLIKLLGLAALVWYFVLRKK